MWCVNTVGQNSGILFKCSYRSHRCLWESISKVMLRDKIKLQNDVRYDTTYMKFQTHQTKMCIL